MRCNLFDHCLRATRRFVVFVDHCLVVLILTCAALTVIVRLRPLCQTLGRVNDFLVIMHLYLSVADYHSCRLLVLLLLG